VTRKSGLDINMHLGWLQIDHLRESNTYHAIALGRKEDDATGIHHPKCSYLSITDDLQRIIPVAGGGCKTRLQEKSSPTDYD